MFTKEQAIAYAEAESWIPLSLRERAEVQLVAERSCMPFGVFHEAIEKTLKRPVYTHEFGFNWEGLKREVFEGAEPPTLMEILGMIPADKPLVIVTVPAQEEVDA